MAALFRYRDGVVPNLLALGWTFGAYGSGIWLMTRPEWVANAAGVLLTAHGLVISAYLLHDCAHGAVFAKPAANDAMGAALSWLSGACVASYAGIKEKHLRHHADRLDVVTFDYRAILRAAPRPVLSVVLALEWAHLPAIEFLMRLMVIRTALADPQRRGLVAGIIGLRLCLFAALFWISPKALLLYALAYVLFVQVLRFLDAFQHTFEVYVSPTLEPAAPAAWRDRRYEHEHTFSNLISRRPWLNLLALNFAYHNIHHARPALPWYQLPAAHAAAYGAGEKQVITCRELLASYHRHRVARVLAEDCGEVRPDGDRAGGFLGAIGVSFLTAT
jgi:fatty acid desaturase